MEVVNSIKNNIENTLKQGGDRALKGSLEFRCPQCFKLYHVDSTSIHSSQPQFECQICRSQFTFTYPPANPQMIYTKALSFPQAARLQKIQKLNELSKEKIERISLHNQKIIEKNKLKERNIEHENSQSENVKNEVSENLKECLNCRTLNPKIQIECYKCGVVFDKSEIVQKHGALPSLVKMWSELMSDYSNVTKHVAFVNRCEDLHALPFALKKYQELKEVQPQDSMVDQMLRSVFIKNVAANAVKMAEHPNVKWIKQIPYRNIFRLLPFMFGFVSLFIGLISSSNRNFVGFGITIFALSLGVLYFLKGRISWADVWKP